MTASRRGSAISSAAARDAQRQGDAFAIPEPGNSRLLQTAAARRIPGTFWILSFSTSLGSCRRKETDRTGSRIRFPASSRKPTPGVSSERPLHHTHPRCLPTSKTKPPIKCPHNRQRQKRRRKQKRLPA